MIEPRDDLDYQAVSWLCNNRYVQAYSIYGMPDDLMSKCQYSLYEMWYGLSYGSYPGRHGQLVYIERLTW